MRSRKPIAGRLFSLCTCLLVIAATARAGELPVVSPEMVGISSAKLDLVKPVVQALVDDKQIAGAATMVARRGNVVHFETYGTMDFESGRPMRNDAIFRIYSMSKPITTVAAMMLWEEGEFRLDDPVSIYIPELKGLDVYGQKAAGKGGEMTIRDLMRHTSGLTYGYFGTTPVDQMYIEQSVLDRDSSLKTMVSKLGNIPLLYEPGKRFQYSVSVDVLGRLVEVISLTRLDDFFASRIFEPLDMHDTAFYVPGEKLDRFTSNYRVEDDGRLRVIDAPSTSVYRASPGLLSGGGGLVSTARDYMRFCQMISGGGQLDGTRLLRSETVAIMSQNQLPPEATPIVMSGTARPGVGFGLGFSVRVESQIAPAGHVVGEFGWGGAASTHFWISPKHELVVIVLQQVMPYTSRLERAIKPIVYAAITD